MAVSLSLALAALLVPLAAAQQWPLVCSTTGSEWNQTRCPASATCCASGERAHRRAMARTCLLVQARANEQRMRARPLLCRGVSTIRRLLAGFSLTGVGCCPFPNAVCCPAGYQ